ncbi:ATP-binding protein [Psychrobacter sp. Ps1]|uniref:AAA family ATPase n=1 Tax=Psychrobacter sp. Ps1 TaxID=2790955 RepID=UPI001EDD6A1A|nr:ATP-binding protein [Psychrobacter sp. Ps1]MCG3842252.1 ATP-binding protein [Psychrobacter sp. Ps1]
MNNQSAFARHDYIDNDYQVKFFLGNDAIAETYQIITGQDQLKILKLIKPESISIIDLELLKSKLGKYSRVLEDNVISNSILKSFTNERQQFFYFLQDFVVGESLLELINREIYLDVYLASKIANLTLILLSKLDCLEGITITPDKVFLSYLSDELSIYLAPFSLTDFILDETKGVPTLSFVYGLDSNFQQSINSFYSVATLLYRCIVGMLPWDYDIDWSRSKISILKITQLHRASFLLKKSNFYQFMPEELGNILYEALAYEKLDTFADDIGSFIQRYYEFSKYEDYRGVEDKQNDEIIAINEKSVGLAQVAGMKGLKETLQIDVINPLKDRTAHLKYGIQPLNGLLLYGPPGCGKTFIARQLAEELGYRFFEVKPSDLASTYVHGTQEKIGKLFRDARLNAPSIIFIDEVDAILPSRDSDNLNHHYSSEVNEFLAQLTDCNERGIFVVMASNRPDVIDKAILRTGRIDKIIYVSLPDFISRKELLKLLLENRPKEKLLDLDSLSMLLAGYVSSDIKFIVNEVAKIAMKNEQPINSSHFMNITQKTAPSVSFDQIERYDSFANLSY